MIFISAILWNVHLKDLYNLGNQYFFTWPIHDIHSKCMTDWWILTWMKSSMIWFQIPQCNQPFLCFGIIAKMKYFPFPVTWSWLPQLHYIWPQILLERRWTAYESMLCVFILHLVSSMFNNITLGKM